MNAWPPNPRFRSPDDLNLRDREHFEVAKSLGLGFRTAEFIERYAAMFPDRAKSSMMPSDYCFNRDNKGNAKYPRFLRWDGTTRYSFVGLTANERHAEELSPTGVGVAGSRPRRSRSREQRSPLSRFVPDPAASLVLSPDIAAEAVRRYNDDSRVTAQERRATIVIGKGFSKGHVIDQLAALNVAYRTRTHTTDVIRIAKTIYDDWDRWIGTLSDLHELREQVPTFGTLEQLLKFFLEQSTVRRPRSLATKALHFAAPKTFCPVDDYAAGTLKWLRFSVQRESRS